ncbi:MAG: ribonuclease P protein component [Cyclobacteriaceae bacterium]
MIEENTRFTFSKSERITSKKDIDALFESMSFFIYPFKVFYLENENPTIKEHKTLISVSKRRFKKAVTRNLFKRRIREAYRLNKHSLQPIDGERYLLIGFLYVGKQTENFQFIEKKLNLIINRLNTSPESEETHKAIIKKS